MKKEIKAWERGDKIENIEKVFIVVRQKSRRVKPERFYNEHFNCDMFAVFPNRKNAQKWCNSWVITKNFWDILERKLV